MTKQSIHVTETHAGIDHELRWDGGRKILWVASDGSVRTPEESNKTFLYPGPFFAAGKAYVSWKGLCVEQTESGLCRDLYGREVFYMAERFPCFDSYDYMYEKRYYRRYLIFADGTRTRVFLADESPNPCVTEDVRLLENDLWDELQKAE